MNGLFAECGVVCTVVATEYTHMSLLGITLAVAFCRFLWRGCPTRLWLHSRTKDTWFCAGGLGSCKVGAAYGRSETFSRSGHTASEKPI